MLQKKYYYVFYDKSFGKGGQEGRGYYYKSKKINLYLRFAVFKKGNLTALVSSQHSLKKIKKILSKPKPLMINRCCAFKVLETKFQPNEQNYNKQYFQISHDKGKTYFDYEKGSNNKIDSLFKNIKVFEMKKLNWIMNDFAEIFEPYFEINEVTNQYNSGGFQLNRFCS